MTDSRPGPRPHRRPRCRRCRRRHELLPHIVSVTENPGSLSLRDARKFRERNLKEKGEGFREAQFHINTSLFTSNLLIPSYIRLFSDALDIIPQLDKRGRERICTYISTMRIIADFLMICYTECV